MRDAPGHIRPGRGTLGRNEIGNVVERDDIAGFSGSRFAANLHAQDARLAGSFDGGFSA